MITGVQLQACVELVVVAYGSSTELGSFGHQCSPGEDNVDFLPWSYFSDFLLLNISLTHQRSCIPSSYPMSDICDWCNHRLMRLVPKYWRSAYIVDSRDIISINTEANKGCTICKLLRESLVALQANVEDDTCRVMTIAVPTMDQRQFTLRFRYSLSSGAPSKVFTFCLQGICHTPTQPWGRRGLGSKS